MLIQIPNQLSDSNTLKEPSSYSARRRPSRQAQLVGKVPAKSQCHLPSTSSCTQGTGAPDHGCSCAAQGCNCMARAWHLQGRVQLAPLAHGAGAGPQAPQPISQCSLTGVVGALPHCALSRAPQLLRAPTPGVGARGWFLRGVKTTGTRSRVARSYKADLDHRSTTLLWPGATISHRWQTAGKQRWGCAGANPASAGPVREQLRAGALGRGGLWGDTWGGWCNCFPVRTSRLQPQRRATAVGANRG